MKKKLSSKSAFFNFRVLILLCAAGTALMLAAFGARPSGSARSQPSEDQNRGVTRVQQPGSNSLPPSGPGIVPHQRASSSGFTLMEGPGPDGETVTTDKSDYMPGETVVIGGTGWIPNEAVALNITDSNGVDRWDVSVTADASGNISNSDFVIQPEDVGLAFTLTATQGTVTAWTQFTDVIGTGIAPNGDPGGFEILGNVVASAAPHTDWVDTTPGTNGLLNPTTGAPLDATVTYRRLDAFNGSDDIFAQSNKTNDDPNTYNWKTSGAVNKDDLNNVYVHISIDGIGHRWITASADRLSNGGTAFADFELNQAIVTKVTDTGCASAPCGHFVTNPLNASTGGRTPNDLLVTANYGNGGTVATVIVYRWQQVPPVTGTWQWVDITSSVPDGAAFVGTNTGPGPDDHPAGPGIPVPYMAFGHDYYNQNQFVEMSLDLSALLAAIDPCSGIQIKTVFVKTKTSTATTASLDDLVDPIPVSFGIGLAVTGSQTDPLCNGGTGTVTATWSGGTGPFECKLDVGGTYASCSSPKSYSGLAAGSTHTIFVRDTSSTCVKDTGPITLGNPSAVVASSSNPPILCNGGSTTVTVGASGGTSPYTGTGTFSRSAGTYSFTVTDGNGCTATTTGD
ncbi:MAG: hypothetical protein ACM3KL_07485, partial [Alphaproteobacteria bacterium]